MPRVPRRPLLLLTAAATAAAGLSSGASPASPGTDPTERVVVVDRAGRADEPASYDFLRARILTAPGLGTVAVGMPDRRRVKLQRLDEATGTWSRPALLFEQRGLTCGDIEAATSPGGIALTLACDAPYVEEGPPGHSQAVVTTDLRRWTISELPGEGGRAPAISPDGASAAWLAGPRRGDVVLWRAGTGFARPVSTPFPQDNDNGNEIVVVSDDDAVTVLGTGVFGGVCGLGAYERTPAGATSTQPVLPAVCADEGLRAVDALRVVSGRTREGRSVVARADAGSPWRTVSVPPIDAPGLVDDGWDVETSIPTSFSDVPGQDLLAIGSPDRRRVYVQSFDEAAGRWGARRLVYDHGFPGCTSGDFTGQGRHGVHRMTLNCYPAPRASGHYPPVEDHIEAAPSDRVRLLLSPDGVSWRAVSLRGRPYGVSRDGSLLAAPGPRATTVVSPAGFTRVPVRIRGACDVVFPTSTDRLLRLHRRPGRAWPDLVQRYAGSGTWRTIQRLRFPDRPRCRSVVADQSRLPTRFVFVDGSSPTPVVLSFRRGEHGAWRAVRRTDY